MKNYNVQQSWELLKYDGYKNNDVTYYYLKEADGYYIPHTSFFDSPISALP